MFNITRKFLLRFVSCKRFRVVLNVGAPSYERSSFLSYMNGKQAKHYGSTSSNRRGLRNFHARVIAGELQLWMLPTGFRRDGVFKTHSGEGSNRMNQAKKIFE
jgi:hypothetical protein